MDEFAFAFQAFALAEDFYEIPEELREAYAIRGIKRCRSKGTPCFRECFREGEGLSCACLMRMRRLRAFWKLVKADIEDALPTLLTDSQISPLTGPYHKPIFTYVCRGCGVARDVYHENYARQPASPTGWYVVAHHVMPLARFKGWTKALVEEPSVCSKECIERLTRETDPYGRFEGLVRNIHVLGRPNLDDLAYCLGMSAEPDTPTARYRDKVLKRFDELANEYSRRLGNG